LKFLLSLLFLLFSSRTPNSEKWHLVDVPCSDHTFILPGLLQSEPEATIWSLKMIFLAEAPRPPQERENWLEHQSLHSSPLCAFITSCSYFYPTFILQTPTCVLFFF
jgi:hypothetical protein